PNDFWFPCHDVAPDDALDIQARIRKLPKDIEQDQLVVALSLCSHGLCNRFRCMTDGVARRAPMAAQWVECHQSRHLVPPILGFHLPKTYLAEPQLLGWPADCLQAQLAALRPEPSRPQHERQADRRQPL